jgi:protein-disulfide isomerase
MSPRRAVPQKKQGGLPSWVIPVAVVVVVIVAVVALFTLQTPTAAPVSSSGLSAPGRTVGNPNSKVAFVEFSDFQWPYCRAFALGAGRQIEDQYVKTNKISFTYKYFPVADSQSPTKESHWAAEAAECANQQSKFWEYHDKLFAVWTGENVGTFTKPNLKKYAADLGLDATKFNSCIDNDQTASIVQADENEAQSLNLPGTPSFLINGSVFQSQTLNFSEFSRTFDSLLK